MKISKFELILIGLSIALVFALGFDIILYNKEHRDSRSVSQLQQADHLKAEAVFETCIKTRSANTQFILSLKGAFQRQEENARAALHETSPLSTLYKTRRAAVDNYRLIVKQLAGFLPIKCKFAE